MPAFLFLLLSLNSDLERLVENGHFKRARALVAQQAQPQDARGLALAAKIHLAYSELDQAARLAERAAALEPRNADHQFLLCEIYGTQAQRASLLRQPFLGRKTKKAMDAAIALDPNHVDTLTVLMLYYYQAPSLIGGDKEKARALPAKIRQIDPARGWLAEARLAALEKNPARQEEAYRKAAEANPRHYASRLALASHYFDRRKDYASAAIHARAAHELEPDRAAPFALLAAAAALQGQLDEMDEWLRKAEKQVPDDRYPHLAAARALLQAKRELTRAKNLIMKYLEQEPEAIRPPHEQVRKELRAIDGIR
jgi:hypothetical protein